MTMDKVAEFENTENPKEAIKKLVADAKKRRKAMSIDDSELAVLTKNEPV